MNAIVNEVKNSKLGRSLQPTFKWWFAFQRIGNCYFISKPPINMSNYLFVAGETGSIQKLMSHFKGNFEMNEQQISTHKISNEKSVFVIERRNKEIDSSILVHNSSEGVYFRGQALDHETSSMILGVKGFFNSKKHFPITKNRCISQILRAVLFLLGGMKTRSPFKAIYTRCTG